MASVGEVLYELLVNGDTGDEVGTRIYPVRAPQSAKYPLVTYQRVGGARESDHEDDTLQWPRVQVVAYAKTHRAAEALADAIEADLDGYKGTVRQVEIQHIERENRLDQPFDPDDTAFGILLDFFIWYQE